MDSGVHFDGSKWRQSRPRVMPRVGGGSLTTFLKCLKSTLRARSSRRVRLGSARRSAPTSDGISRAVTRLVCKATTLDVDMIVDIANEVYSLEKESRFAMHLTSTLRKDGRPDDDAFDQSGRESLLDDFDYGMCGRVFQYDVSAGKV
jgi:hypothetical protein